MDVSISDVLTGGKQLENAAELDPKRKNIPTGEVADAVPKMPENQTTAITGESGPENVSGEILNEAKTEKKKKKKKKEKAKKPSDSKSTEENDGKIKAELANASVENKAKNNQAKQQTEKKKKKKAKAKEKLSSTTKSGDKLEQSVKKTLQNEQTSPIENTSGGKSMPEKKNARLLLKGTGRNGARNKRMRSERPKEFMKERSKMFTNMLRIRGTTEATEDIQETDSSIESQKTRRSKKLASNQPDLKKIKVERSADDVQCNKTETKKEQCPEKKKKSGNRNKNKSRKESDCKTENSGNIAENMYIPETNASTGEAKSDPKHEFDETRSRPPPDVSREGLKKSPEFTRTGSGRSGKRNNRAKPKNTHWVSKRKIFAPRYSLERANLEEDTVDNFYEYYSAEDNVLLLSAEKAKTFVTKSKTLTDKAFSEKPEGFGEQGEETDKAEVATDERLRKKKCQEVILTGSGRSGKRKNRTQSKSLLNSFSKRNIFQPRYTLEGAKGAEEDMVDNFYEYYSAHDSVLLLSAEKAKLFAEKPVRSDGQGGDVQNEMGPTSDNEAEEKAKDEGKSKPRNAEKRSHLNEGVPRPVTTAAETRVLREMRSAEKKGSLRSSSKVVFSESPVPTEQPGVAASKESSADNIAKEEKGSCEEKKECAQHVRRVTRRSLASDVSRETVTPKEKDDSLPATSKSESTEENTKQQGENRKNRNKRKTAALGSEKNVNAGEPDETREKPCDKSESKEISSHTSGTRTERGSESQQKTSQRSKTEVKKRPEETKEEAAKKQERRSTRSRTRSERHLQNATEPPNPSGNTADSKLRMRQSESSACEQVSGSKGDESGKSIEKLKGKVEKGETSKPATSEQPTPLAVCKSSQEEKQETPAETKKDSQKKKAKTEECAQGRKDLRQTRQSRRNVDKARVTSETQEVTLGNKPPQDTKRRILRKSRNDDKQHHVAKCGTGDQTDEPCAETTTNPNTETLVTEEAPNGGSKLQTQQPTVIPVIKVPQQDEAEQKDATAKNDSKLNGQSLVEEELERKAEKMQRSPNSASGGEKGENHNEHQKCSEDILEGTKSVEELRASLGGAPDMRSRCDPDHEAEKQPAAEKVRFPCNSAVLTPH